MPTMKMTLRGRQRLTDREGKILKWYKDSKGIWTCLVGHTDAAGEPYYKDTKNKKFTAEDADKVLEKDLASFETFLNKAIKVPVKDNEFDALLSVMFNVGPKFAASTAIKRLNAGESRARVAEAIAMWKIPPEIIKRRNTEISQFLTPYVLGTK